MKGLFVISVWFPSFDVPRKRKRWVWKLDFNIKKREVVAMLTFAKLRRKVIV